VSICCCICSVMPREWLRGIGCEQCVQVRDAKSKGGGCGEAKHTGSDRTRGDAPMGVRGRRGHAGAQGASRHRGARLSPEQTSLLLEQTAALPGNAVRRR